MEENNLPDAVQGIIDDMARRIRTVLDAEAANEATRDATKFDAKTTDGTSIVIDANEQRAGTLIGVRGGEWMYKHPVLSGVGWSKQWESWDGEAASVSEFAEMCRAAHANGSTPTLIHEGC